MNNPGIFDLHNVDNHGLNEDDILKVAATPTADLPGLRFNDIVNRIQDLAKFSRIDSAAITFSPQFATLMIRTGHGFATEPELLKDGTTRHNHVGFLE